MFKIESQRYGSLEDGKETISNSEEQTRSWKASIRQEKINPQEYKADYRIITDLDIEFLTDSSILADNIERTSNQPSSGTPTQLIYLTQSEILPSDNEFKPKKWPKGFLVIWLLLLI